MPNEGKQMNSGHNQARNNQARPTGQRSRSSENRNSNRKPYNKGNHSNDRKPYGNRSEGNRKPYEKRNGERKSYGNRDDKRKSYDNKSGDRKFNDRKSGDRKPYNKDNRNNDRKPYGNRSEGNRKPYENRNSDRKPYEKRNGERKSYDNKSGDRKPYNKDNRSNDRKPFDKRKQTKKVDVSPARVFALEIGKEVREREAFAHDLITRHIDNYGLNDKDKAFATKLALGVTMSYGVLDEVINRHLRKPSDVQPAIRDALRISVYEIIYLEKSAHAAVDQGVNLVRLIEPKATGLANAVLHRVVEDTNRFPYGNPEISLSAFAREQAFPLWLAKQLEDDRGTDAAKDIMRASNGVAPLFVAFNAGTANREESLTTVQSFDNDIALYELEGHTIENCYKVENPRIVAVPEVNKLFKTGAMFASDASAQEVAWFVLPEEKPERFLEVGSGRGTKTLLLQNDALIKYGEQLNLEAIDVYEFKTELLTQRCERSGIELSAAHTLDGRKIHEEFEEDTFDTVFVDAPCSGLGTLRRHPEIRWRITPKDISELAQLNEDILCSAARCVKKGGQLVYATCTVTQKENEQVVEHFLKSSAGERFKLVPYSEDKDFFMNELVPGGPDAHFAAKFERII